MEKSEAELSQEEKDQILDTFLGLLVQSAHASEISGVEFDFDSTEEQTCTVTFDSREEWDRFNTILSFTQKPQFVIIECDDDEMTLVFKTT